MCVVHRTEKKLIILVKWKLFTGVEGVKERLCSEGVSFEFLRNEIQI